MSHARQAVFTSVNHTIKNFVVHLSVFPFSNVFPRENQTFISPSTKSSAAMENRGNLIKRKVAASEDPTPIFNWNRFLPYVSILRLALNTTVAS